MYIRIRMFKITSLLAFLVAEKLRAENLKSNNIHSGIKGWKNRMHEDETRISHWN